MTSHVTWGYRMPSTNWVLFSLRGFRIIWLEVQFAHKVQMEADQEAGWEEGASVYKKMTPFHTAADCHSSGIGWACPHLRQDWLWKAHKYRIMSVGNTHTHSLAVWRGRSCGFPLPDINIIKAGWDISTNRKRLNYTDADVPRGKTQFGGWTKGKREMGGAISLLTQGLFRNQNNNFCSFLIQDKH